MSVESDREIRQLESRFQELANKSCTRNICTFTDFLGLAEQDVFWRMEAALRYAGYYMWGGTDNSERVVIRFGEADASKDPSQSFNISCIHIRPSLEKFGEELSHRDYLGALMNLGISRNTLGDIRVSGKEAYLFCLKNVDEYICDNLVQVRHTNVKCSMVDPEDLKNMVLPGDKPTEMVIQTSSVRVDAVIAGVYRKSRSQVSDMFHSGLVYLNGRLCENDSKMLKDGDTVNVRGYGKFVFRGIDNRTRKGKLKSDIELFK